MDLATYLTKFQWDIAKFPIKQSLRGIVDAINSQCTQIENDLKTKASNYNNLKSNLANMERKQTYVVFFFSLFLTFLYELLIDVLVSTPLSLKTKC